MIDVTELFKIISTTLLEMIIRELNQQALAITDKQAITRIISLNNLAKIEFGRRSDDT